MLWRDFLKRKMTSVSPSPTFTCLAPLCTPTEGRETREKLISTLTVPVFFEYGMQLPQATRVVAQRGGPLAPRALPQKPTRGVAAARSMSATASDVGPATASLVASGTPKPLKKVAMISLGCPKNTVDGEVVLWLFNLNGKVLKVSRCPTTTPARFHRSSRRTKRRFLPRTRVCASPLAFALSVPIAT